MREGGEGGRECACVCVCVSEREREREREEREVQYMMRKFLNTFLHGYECDH